MPKFPNFEFVNSLIISPASPESIGNELNNSGSFISSATWPSANRAIFVPFTVYEPLLIVKMFIENGATIAGNVDVGIYNLNQLRLVSSGSVLQSGTSIIQEFNITDILLEPGFYYLAMAMSNATGTTIRWNPAPVNARGFGVMEQSNAFPLPVTGTFTQLSSSIVPAIFATTRFVI